MNGTALSGSPLRLVTAMYATGATLAGYGTIGFQTDNTACGLPPSSGIPFAPGILITNTMTFGFEVGTGGASTVAYLRKRGNKGYPLASYSVSETAEDATVNRTPAQNLAQIRAVLKPAVTELADILRVSRQAVYDWQAGKPIAPDNAARLADIARAADAFALEGLSGNREILARAITEGKNFYDLIRDGRAADAAARALIEIVGVEMRQREALRKRLAARKRPAREAFEDIGAPHLEERG